MKKLAKACLVFGFTSAVAVTTAMGQVRPLITVDENGHGNITGTPLPFTVSTEPLSGIATLTYFLPFAGVAGDVLMLDNFATNDVIRFDGQGRMWFFSDREPTDVQPFDLADMPQL